MDQNTLMVTSLQKFNGDITSSAHSKFAATTFVLIIIKKLLYFWNFLRPTSDQNIHQITLFFFYCSRRGMPPNPLAKRIFFKITIFYLKNNILDTRLLCGISRDEIFKNIYD